MAWTAPMTAVDGGVLTAADWNTYVRDNLNETAVAKATTAGRYFVSGGQNIVVEKALANDTVNTLDSTDSTSYDDLPSTSGPIVTVTAENAVWYLFSAQVQSSTAGAVAYVGVELASDAETIAPDNANRPQLVHEISAANDTYRVGMWGYWQHGFSSPQTITLTMKYKSPGGQTISFRHRSLIALPH